MMFEDQSNTVLLGAPTIAREVYGSDDAKTVRRLRWQIQQGYFKGVVFHIGMKLAARRLSLQKRIAELEAQGRAA